MPELFIFKAGNYPQGNWSKERVKKFVDAYDPENAFEAPAVIGHRFQLFEDADQFAHGWIKSLRMDDAGKVYAEIPEFSAEARQAIIDKKLRYISAEIYEYDKVDESKPPYLKAIALLGRDTPAIAGTKIPAMFNMAFGGFSSAVDEENKIATFTRRANAREIMCLSASGKEISEEDKVMGKAWEKLEEKIKKLEEKIAELRKYSEPKESANHSAADVSTEVAALRKENEELKSAGRKAEAEAFFGKLRDEGKLPPAQFDKIVAMDTKLSDEDRKELRATFAALEPKMNLSGKHVADKGKAPASASSAFGEDLTAKIRAFQTEHKLASFYDAAIALQAEKPELFEEEDSNA